ncbi:nuclear transport factor 2 family protein [Penaeicola halotolerans]|uniref:nuclear transport factor 2 family protein n=1 Tax=Penaeicola halotolerans TaxID=2793196 RepID=UPI001CF8C82F|nr:nuclear transport factor 2 family protein [Penaeicola halotolerans]
MEAQQKTMVESYIDAYNSFDVEGMTQHLDDALIFENIAGDEVNLHIEGLDAFKKQAKEATQYFSERKQTVESWTFGEEKVQIKISYFAVVAVDLPNGLKKGDTLQLEGESIFKFKGDKIVKITDKS